MDSQILDYTISFVQAHSIGMVSFVALVLSLSGNMLINFRGLDSSYGLRPM